MEETTLPIHSWFWLFAPMIAVFVLSILNYLRKRGSADVTGFGVSGKSASETDAHTDAHTDAPMEDRS